MKVKKMFNLFKCKHPFEQLETTDKAQMKYLDDSSEQVFPLKCKKCGTELKLYHPMNDKGRIRKVASRKPPKPNDDIVQYR